MAVIAIGDLSITGSILFSDSESYLDQLSESDTLNIQGGYLLTIAYSTTCTTYTTYTTKPGPMPTPPVYLP